MTGSSAGKQSHWLLYSEDEDKADQDVMQFDRTYTLQCNPNGEVTDKTVEDSEVEIQGILPNVVKFETDQIESDSPTKKLYETLDAFFKEVVNDGNGSDLIPRSLKYDNEDEAFKISIGPTKGAKRRVGFCGLEIGEKTDLDGICVADEIKDRGWKGRLRVNPKIPDAAWEELFAMAGGDLEDTGEMMQAGIGSNDGNFPFEHILAAAYVHRLERLFDNYGGLQKRHVRLEREFEAEVRGRMRVSEYAVKLARGEVTSVPCEVSELQLDNFPNRTLRYALDIANRLRKLEAAGADTLRDRILALTRRFGDVERTRILTGELQQLETLPSSFEGYQNGGSGALPFARRLIETTGGVSLSAGKQELPGFTLNMADIYEEAFAECLADYWDLDSDDISQVSDSFTVGKTGIDDNIQRQNGGSDGGIRPDVYVTGDQLDHTSTGVVVDTKWKKQGDDWNITRSDHRQITTYTHYADLDSANEGAAGFLIYPTDTGSKDDITAEPISWEGVGSVEPQVYAIKWPVQRGADHSVSTRCRQVVDAIEEVTE